MHLAPVVPEEILFLEVPPGEQPISERALRDQVLKSLDWKEQQRRWEALRRGIPTHQRPARQ